MEFPFNEYKEIIKKIIKWNSIQVISYVDMKEPKCINYKHCKSAISGFKRANKLHYMNTNLENINYAYQLTKKVIFANLFKKVFNRLHQFF